VSFVLIVDIVFCVVYISTPVKMKESLKANPLPIEQDVLSALQVLA
jgi:hypothetical protein